MNSPKSIPIFLNQNGLQIYKVFYHSQNFLKDFFEIILLVLKPTKLPLAIHLFLELTALFFFSKAGAKVSDSFIIS